MNETRETYYEALQRSTQGWHEGAHTIWPWVEYLFGTVVAAYGELDRRMAMAAPHGSKQIAVRDHIRTRLVDVFSIEDLRAVTTASDALIKKVLRDLQKEGAVEIFVRGRYAKYRRLRTGFPSQPPAPDQTDGRSPDDVVG